VQRREIMDKPGEQTAKYGVIPVDVMASMSGLDFVRAIFARRLPEPPIMETVGPFDYAAESGAVVIHSVPALRHDNPIGSVHDGYAALRNGLAVQATLTAGTDYTTLEYRISFVRGISETSGVVRIEGRALDAGRRVATAEARITMQEIGSLHATTTNG
jgi:acyl-coenzyme A thioesterase PaaI-like protein